MSQPPSCWICQHAEIFAGRPSTLYEPGEGPYAACNLFDTGKMLGVLRTMKLETDEAEQLLPKICNRFEPIDVTCVACGAVIKATDVYAWMPDLHEQVPVCCMQCEATWNEEFGDAILEMLRQTLDEESI